MIYYNYRKEKMNQKQHTDLGYWWDLLSYYTCGYGVKPSYAIRFGIIVISFFSILYANPISLNINRHHKIPIRLSLNVYLDKINNKLIPFRLSLKNPGILKDRDLRDRDQNQNIYLIDMFFYSVGCFTFMSHDNWYPKNNFRGLVAFEGALGWFILGIFMATLGKIWIRF